MTPTMTVPAASQDPADPLAALKDLRLPSDPSWWPPAPGWWLLALLLLVVLSGLVVVALRARASGRPVREARRALGEIEADFAEDGDRARAARQVSELLRRYLMARLPPERVAGLQGRQWARFLAAHCPRLSLDHNEVAALIESTYRPDPPDLARLFELARAVIDSRPAADPVDARRQGKARAVEGRLVPGRAS